MPEKQLPGAWPESPHLSDSPQESCPPSPPSCSATHPAKKPGPLRIIVPPTEYCPFSTDLTLPITPLSLPTPVSSSCFTFTGIHPPASQTAPALPPRSQSTDFASPTSTQSLLMAPTSHSEDEDGAPPLATPATTNESAHSGSSGTKSASAHPWVVSSSTWLSDLGGHTETDHIFRRNLPDMSSFDTDSSPASTPALSRSAVSPSSQVSSLLAYNLSPPPARPPPPPSPALSLCSPTMSPDSLPTRLALKPTGTDTFPSTLDSLQAWRESVTPGFPQSEERYSPPTEDVHGARLEGLVPEADSPVPVHLLHSHHRSLHASHVPRSRTLMKRAKMLGGRVRQLVTRQRHRGSMDRGVNFRVVTSQDSENGSVILITAPPPPYGISSLTLVPHGPVGQEHTGSRTVSEYSSIVQDGTGGVATTSRAEPAPRPGGENRNTLRRLSLAALSTIKRI